MRKSEVLKLEWDQVDLQNEFILLKNTKNDERREIPINDTLKNVFRRIQRQPGIAYVFPNPATGQPYDDVKNSFNGACRRAGIRDFRFHDLRHTFASHLAMSGADLSTVQHLLGHKTVTMTMRYAHLSPGHMKEAVKNLDKILNGQPTVQKVYNWK